MFSPTFSSCQIQFVAFIVSKQNHYSTLFQQLFFKYIGRDFVPIKIGEFIYTDSFMKGNYVKFKNNRWRIEQKVKGEKCKLLCGSPCIIIIRSAVCM